MSASVCLNDVIPSDMLRKYITYAKTYVHPELSQEAANKLQQVYLEMRKSEDNVLPITTRQLESLIRLSQARARCELRQTVTEQDAIDVIEILKQSLIETHTNEMGELDFGRSGGMSLTKKVKSYMACLKKNVRERNTEVFTFDQLLAMANRMGLKVDNFYDFLEILRNECYLLKKGPKLYKVQLT